jgi:predicted transcriptional regulator
MTDEVKGTLFGIMERWGFPTLVAIVAMWVLRQDVLQSHKQFVEQLGETQQDISKAIQEQTRLLYAMQPGRSAAARMPDTDTAN